MKPLALGGLILATCCGCGAPAVATDGGMDDLAPAVTDDLASVPPDLRSSRCPAGMTIVGMGNPGSTCVDRFESALVQQMANGTEAPYPFNQTIGSATVRAVVADGIRPQAYISADQAQAACMRSGKRLCKLEEWLAACQGPNLYTYPYGNTYMKGACNEGRATNPVNDVYGPSATFDATEMNDPQLDTLPNTVAPGGAFPMCVSTWGIYDLHGNVHEWIDATTSAGNGEFKGGFFVDATLNGPGCRYATTAHAKSYHDYSTGFRCCAAPR